MSTPIFETDRLLIRPLAMDDLQDIHRILDIELAEVNWGHDETKAMDERKQWLHWTVMGYEQLDNLPYQPRKGVRNVQNYSPVGDVQGNTASSL
jgi:RimJ/RimL family protein N-acetyltransferase